MTQLSLLEPPPVIAVHCFFGCKHVVRDESPTAAHDSMERHYVERHALKISELCGAFS